MTKRFFVFISAVLLAIVSICACGKTQKKDSTITTTPTTIEKNTEETSIENTSDATADNEGDFSSTYKFIPEEYADVLLDEKLIDSINANTTSDEVTNDLHWFRVIASVKGNAFAEYLKDILTQLHADQCTLFENDELSFFMSCSYLNLDEIFRIANVFALGYDENGMFSTACPIDDYYGRLIIMQTVDNEWYCCEYYGYENKPTIYAKSYYLGEDYYSKEESEKDSVEWNNYTLNKVPLEQCYTYGETALAYRAGCIAHEYMIDVYNPYAKNLNKKHEEDEWKRKTSQYEPGIGMTKDEVMKSSWGKPSDRNITETIYGTHEQWVYGNGRYVYFDDGYVTAIQKNGKVY